MDIFALLTSSSGAPSSGPFGGMGSMLFLGGMIVLLVVMFVVQNRKQKKQQEEQEETKNAIRPGNKVKTIGGICGIVVEVNPEESTFVLETGSDAIGKSYVKFDMQAIYQTDAKPEKKEEPKEEKKWFGRSKKKAEAQEEKIEESEAVTEEPKAE